MTMWSCTLAGMTTDSSPDHINGVAVHSSGSGTGPAIVLLHANGGCARDYDAVIPHLAMRSVVHAIDWPGHGESEAADDATAIGYASRLPGILEALPGGPFVLLGNSVGGFAALHTAADQPTLVRALVLVSPGGFTPRWPTTFAACAFMASRPVAPRAMRMLPRLYLRRRTQFVEQIHERARAAAADPRAVATFASLWRSFTDRRHDARGAAAQVSVPTLLAWGRRDPVLPWMIDGRRARSALAHADVVTFDCGHQPYAEQPERFLAALDGFLDRHALVGP